MAQDDKTASSKSSTTVAATWPDKSLICMTGEEAKQHILDTDASVLVQILPEGSIVTMDYSLDRVRIFVDEVGKVVSQPKRG